jgi:hypothetical protein
MSVNNICPYCGTLDCSNYDATKDYHVKCPLCSAAIRPNGVCVNGYSCPNGIPVDLRPVPAPVPSVLDDAVIS